MGDAQKNGKPMNASGDGVGRSSRRRVTSKDVASEAGVSQATVARVFSSPHLAAPQTRARVEAAATRLGYVPNAIARSLKSQKTDIVAAVVPAQGEYWQSMLTSFSRRLAAQGRQMLLFSFAEAADVDSALTAVEQYRVDGVVLASSTISQQQLIRMLRPGPPVVAFNQPAATGVLPQVSVDNEAGMSDLAEHLAGLGVSTVLYVGGVTSASTDQIRYRGAARALGGHGIACPYLEAGAFTYDAGYKMSAQLADMDELPEALMVGSDEVACGVIDGLRTADIDVPGDVLLTGFDGLPQSAWAGYDLTTLVQPIDVLVDEVIELLFRQDTQTSAMSVVVPGSVRVGRTTRRSDG